MRLLLQSRGDLFTHPGGDTVQVQATASALSARGHRVTVDCSLAPSLEGVDVVHLFNLTRYAETLCQSRAARKRGVPYVLSPIHHSLERYNREGRRGPSRWASSILGGEGLERLRILRHGLFTPGLVRTLPQALRPGGSAAARREVLTRAAAVILGSEGEARDLAEETGVPRDERFQVVRLGARVPAEGLDPLPFLELHRGQHPYVLCAGRVEPLKNPVALIRALQDEELPLVFTGSLSPRHPAYVEEFKRALRGRPRTYHRDHLKGELLLSAMASARVHCLVSWAEAVGLVSLEAAACGVAVVSTTAGHAREYLGEEAWYCDPGDLNSIRDAVTRAWREGPPEALAARVRRELTWERAAEALEQVYEQCR